MEAIAAVGLASNVLQFFEFTTKLIRISNELRNDAASSENKDHQVIATHLEGLAQGIKDSAQAISQTSATASSEEKALQPVVDSCCGLAKDLLDRLKKCGIQPGQNASRFRRAKAAFKALWNKKEIEEISNRLQLLRSEINLCYTVQIRKTQLDRQVQQPTADDTIQAVRRKLDGLGPLIDGLKLDIEGAANTQRAEIINSITESRTENSQMHAQATQQSLAHRIILSEKIDDLQASVTTMNTNLKKVQSRQSETFESIAQVRVQNSSFLARATQQVPLDSDSSASFQNVIRPLFKEYMETVHTGIKKEYRTAARSEADHILKELPPTLDKMQSCSIEARENPVDVTDGGRIEADWESLELQDFSVEVQNAERLHKQAPCQPNKNSISVLYQKTWRRKTSLGLFTLIIRDKVQFDLFGRATEVYELTAQFVPSPRWFATGYSMTYESKSDARGSPGFGLKLKTYRVLERDHKAVEAIYKGDVSTLQSMLSQKLISPSDIDEYGWPLLYLAVVRGELDICKVLVHSGADINACDSFGDSILEIAINPRNILDNLQGRDTLHYLLGLPEIELEALLENERIIYRLAYNFTQLSQETLPKLQEWVSVCRFIGIDFNSPDCDSFLTSIIHLFSYYWHWEPTEDRTAAFDAVIQERIGCDRLADTVDIPVAYAASKMIICLWDVDENSLLDDSESSILSVPYRCYYTDRVAAECLNFLEHVISRGIAERPDCIFDSFHGWTISDWFCNTRWWHIWEEILEEHGFDVDWVYEEDERRKRVITGETSAHEVSVGTDASAVRDVRRRRGYENSSD